jgi:3-deoxy-7-phosphoheptulonate synthase
MTHLPILVDPSHGTGTQLPCESSCTRRSRVGADGLLIEVHPCPEEALCDGAQALTPAQYLELVTQVNRLRALIVDEDSRVSVISELAA